jgi:hypothetical protein
MARAASAVARAGKRTSSTAAIARTAKLSTSSAVMCAGITPTPDVATIRRNATTTK